MKTKGLSNKLYGAVAAAILGVVLILIGEHATGTTLVLAAGGILTTGAAAPADKQVPK